MDIQFLGATGTVTGSKYLVTAGAKKILIDCGLFQGLKQLRLRNWARLPIDPAEVDAVILTHAHIDHSGYLPFFVKSGFSGKVYCSAVTRELCDILLPDSAHLQEEEAKYANRKGFSKHRPALPLYTQVEAQQALKLFEPVEFHDEVDLGKGVRFRLARSGHILGSAIVSLDVNGRLLVFSGDLGRSDDAIMRGPEPITAADYLLVESTYGNRLHSHEDPTPVIGAILNRTFERGGVAIMPAFAVGRAQTLMYYIARLKAAGTIPESVPVYLNSPMAAEVTHILHDHRSEHRLDAQATEATCAVAKIVASVEDSKRLNSQKGPMVIISASGMAAGGRVLHHIAAFAPDPRNTLLFAGFQAAGTRGAAIVAGAEAVKIHGAYVPIRAEVANLENLSAHADWSETMEWLRHFPSAPRGTFITHGEPTAADALRLKVKDQLGWACSAPEYMERIVLE